MCSREAWERGFDKQFVAMDSHRIVVRDIEQTPICGCCRSLSVSLLKSLDTDILSTYAVQILCGSGWRKLVYNYHW